MAKMESNKAIQGVIVLVLFSQVALSVLILRHLKVNEKLLDQINQELLQTVTSGEISVPPFVDVSIDDDPWLGTVGAPLTLVEFSDYECPACAEASLLVQEIMADYEEQIRFVYRDFPLENIHPHAFRAAEAANCAGEQGQYWEMHAILFANQGKLDDNNLLNFALDLNLNVEQFTNCLEQGVVAKEVNHDIEEGIQYQVYSTPTFFVNGRRVVGADPIALRAAIEQILGKEGN